MHPMYFGNLSIGCVDCVCKLFGEYHTIVWISRITTECILKKVMGGEMVATAENRPGFISLSVEHDPALRANNSVLVNT